MNDATKSPDMQGQEQTNQDSSFDRKRRIVGAIFGPVCAILVWITPIAGLTPEAHKLLAIMTLVAMWWITEPVPIPVTSLIGPTLCVVTDVAKMKEAFAAFANPMIFLFMGGFIIAKAMMNVAISPPISRVLSAPTTPSTPTRMYAPNSNASVHAEPFHSNPPCSS